jgi:hypothetical protein
MTAQVCSMSPTTRGNRSGQFSIHEDDDLAVALHESIAETSLVCPNHLIHPSGIDISSHVGLKASGHRQRRTYSFGYHEAQQCQGL